MAPQVNRPKIVVIGGGFGGLAAIDELAGAAVDITIIDRRNHHLFQPLLYQVATAALSTSEIAWPIRHLLHRRREVTTLLGHGEWAPFAPGLKTLEDATLIRRKLLLAFERAEREADPDKRRALLTFVIVGAGPTGVELAGAIIELARATLAKDFRALKPAEARVVLVEAGQRVLGTFKPELSAYAQQALETLGVEVRLGRAVTEIDADGLIIGGERLASKTVLWAAGVKASPAAKWLGAPADRAGRIRVEPDLSVPGYKQIFAVGDTATIAMPNGRQVPGVGDGAKQGGRHAARVIKARLGGNDAPMPFVYHHAGDLATIGKRAAVIDFGWIQLKGWIAWWAWGLAHIYFLIGVKNRLFVALSWLWIYLSGQRSARLITQGDAEDRGTGG